MNVLPLSVSTVNLSTSADLIIKLSLGELITILSVTVTWLVTSRVPLIVALSSIETVPPAESRIRLPAVVSISDDPEKPSLMASAVMSVEVIGALNVDVALTVRVSPEASPRVELPST